jgi:acetoin utilization deacetylase AcuC-like enzyme
VRTPTLATEPAPDSGGPAAAEAQRGFFVVDDPLFDEHRSPGYHPERPERLLAVRRALAACEDGGLRTVRLAPRDATDDELARAHAPAYLEALHEMRGLRTAIDDDTFVGPRSVEAAVRAAGGGIAMVEALLDGGPDDPRLALAMVRPPGHHARPDHGMGFCLLNNVATAAHAALARGLQRVAIVDWDVHHGNGTQDVFYREPRVLFASLHQWPMYPGTGAASEAGAGDGVGSTVNVPLSSGASDAAYALAFERIVVPVLERFEPELILVSAGFDAHARDPLADMSLSAEAYRAMATSLVRVARVTAGGRMGIFLEGGYDLAALEASLVATIEGALGVGPGAPASTPTAAARATLDPTHAADVARARSAAALHHRL